MASESVVKRLHVGGITPNITATHLKDRFKSFGTVRDVDELSPDALGMSAFLHGILRNAYHQANIDLLLSLLSRLPRCS